MPRADAVGPLMIACVLALTCASGCGDVDGSASASTSSSSTTALECAAPPAPGATRVPVVVVTQDIPAGTTGTEAAATGMLREDTIPAAFRPADAITSLHQLAGGVAVEDLLENQVVTSAQFGIPPETTQPPVDPQRCDRSPAEPTGTAP